jgi:hypothetical protein
MADAEKTYTIVYVGGPSHGKISTGEDAVGLLRMCGYLPNEDPAAVGHKFRVLVPWYVEYGLRLGLSMRRVFDILSKADIEFDADAVYQLESVGDPIILRFAGTGAEAARQEP